MKKMISILTAGIFVAFVFGVSTASAQEDVARLLKQLEENTDRFSKTLNQGLDQSKYNGTSSEDQINGYVQQFEDSADRLKKNYDKGNDNRVAVQEVLERAKTINTFLKRHPVKTRPSTPNG